MKLSRGDETAEVRVEGEVAVVEGRRVVFHAARPGGRLEAIRLGEDVFPVRTARDGNRVFVWCAGSVHEFRRAARRAAPAGEASGGLLAPMPGRVRRVVLGAGEKVGRGDVILILEAMKMEHAIRAPRDGTVARILFAEGDLVEAGAVLAEIA
jgi:3-methylcrotonyl-CoA carboxylase alpha subunit